MPSSNEYYKLYRRLVRAYEKGDITKDELEISKRDLKNNITHICIHCGSEYTGRKTKQHCNKCKPMPQVKEKPVPKVKPKKERGTWERKKEYIKTCIICGNDFKSKSNHGKFCSSECRKEYKPYTHTCEYCGKEFNSNRKVHKFCTVECIGKSQRKNVSNCINCGVEYVHNKRHAGKFCSRSCYAEYTGIDEINNSKSYLSDGASIRRAKYYGVHYENINVLDVIKRDDCTCQLCGESINLSLKHPHPMSFSLDHIKPLSKGGTHTFENVQSSHLKCNINKSNTL